MSLQYIKYSKSAFLIHENGDVMWTHWPIFSLFRHVHLNHSWIKSSQVFREEAGEAGREQWSVCELFGTEEGSSMRNMCVKYKRSQHNRAKQD